jgi:deoxyadenosine/deoxycytidine kinase
MKKIIHNKEITYMLFPANFVIEILGNIAAGKTTTSRNIAKISSFAYVDCDVYTKNPFLELAVKGPRRWAFTNELNFSYERARKIPHVLKLIQSEPLVLDSGFDMGHFVYAKNGYVNEDMTDEEWKLLTNLHQKLIIHAPRIDAAIFLDVPIDLLMKRMWERGREHEQHYSRKYIEDTQSRIEEYKNDMIALKKRKVIATYHQLEKKLEFHTKEDKKIEKLFSFL